jgi:hypothetical protein
MNDPATPRRNAVEPGAAALWASAFVVAALVILQAGRLPGSSPAHAGTAADIGQVRLLTASAGTNEDILLLVNNTEETMAIYSVENGRSVELQQVARLPELFEQARVAAQGGGRR